jgi:non-ribosomal peptide synthetase component F
VGRDDLVIGTPFANRTQPETEDLIGFFTHILVLRANLSGDPTFRDALSRVRDAALGAYAHQEFPTGRLVEALRADREADAIADRPSDGMAAVGPVQRRNPLFQVMFVLPPLQPFDMPGLTVTPIEVDFVIAPVELTLTMLQTARGFGAFIYNAEIFQPSTIERLAARYRFLLQGLVASPDQPISAAVAAIWNRASEASEFEADRFELLRGHA